MSRLIILMVALFTCVVLCSCEKACRPEVVEITGRWAGVAEDYLDVWPYDASIVLTVTQHDSTVSGTLMSTLACNRRGPCILKDDPLYSGTFHNRELVFTLRHEVDDLEHEFTGHVKRDRIDGIWKSKQLSTGEVWLSSAWHVERVD
jgi:hypothetical protein